MPVFDAVDEKTLNHYLYVEDNGKYAMIRNIVTAYFHPLTGRSECGSVKMTGERPYVEF